MSLVHRPLEALADRLGEDRRENQGVTRVGDLTKKRGRSILLILVEDRTIPGCGTPNFRRTAIDAGPLVILSQGQTVPMTKGDMRQNLPTASLRQAGKIQGAVTATRVIESRVNRSGVIWNGVIWNGVNGSDVIGSRVMDMFHVDDNRPRGMAAYMRRSRTGVPP